MDLEESDKIRIGLSKLVSISAMLVSKRKARKKTQIKMQKCKNGFFYNSISTATFPKLMVL